MDFQKLSVSLFAVEGEASLGTAKLLTDGLVEFMEFC